MFSSLCRHWKRLLAGRPPRQLCLEPNLILSRAPEPRVSIPAASGSRDGARSGEGRRGSCCDASTGSEDAPHSPQTLPGAARCQCRVRRLSDLGLVPGGDPKRERKPGQDRAALPSALQPLALLILGDFCVFGDLGGGFSMPLPRAGSAFPCPLRGAPWHQPWLGLNLLARIKQRNCLGI